MNERFGPDQFAPVHRRLAEKRGDEKIVPLPAKEQGEPAFATASANEKIDALIGQIAADSMDQIDRVILELESVRYIVRSEGQRVSQEIVGYTGLSQTTTPAMKVIAESLQQWKNRSQNKDRDALA